MNQNKAAVVLRLEDAWAWCMWCHAKLTFHQSCDIPMPKPTAVSLFGSTRQSPQAFVSPSASKHFTIVGVSCLTAKKASLTITMLQHLKKLHWQKSRHDCIACRWEKWFSFSIHPCKLPGNQAWPPKPKGLAWAIQLFSPRSDKTCGENLRIRRHAWRVCEHLHLCKALDFNWIC